MQKGHLIRLAGIGDVALLPDGYFTLAQNGVTDGFALEVDRGTVPERRMRARMRAYGEWTVSGAYRGVLPAASLRVIFAVTSTGRDPKRLEHLKTWCEEEGGRNLFWFVDRTSLAGDLLADPVWLVAGETTHTHLPLSSPVEPGN